MTFGEAIRVGAAMRPTTTGKVFLRLLDGRLAACAMGHAYEALTGLAGERISQQTVAAALGTAFPAFQQRVRCPVQDCGFGSANGKLIADQNGDIRLGDIVWHLNDSHEWSAHQVAEWIDTVTA